MVAELRGRIDDEVSKIILGKVEIKHALLLALFAGGNILVEGSPGTGKTRIANSFAQAIGGSFKRIQCTPDMLPADITGFYLYYPAGTPSFVEGPIFANVVLADELNRTTPRTQSALLEAMQERQVTVDKHTYQLPQPFMVIATQVQTGSEGTYSLAGVQMDRFMLHLRSDYLSLDDEMKVIADIDRIDSTCTQAVTSVAEIMQAREISKQVFVSEDITKYIVSIVGELRADPDVAGGPSPRAGIALFKCARVMALFDGRDYVIPDDVKSLVYAATEHRLSIRAEAEMEGITPSTVIKRTLGKIVVPKLKI
jgi:MoxR-like ATPase